MMNCDCIYCLDCVRQWRTNNDNSIDSNNVKRCPIDVDEEEDADEEEDTDEEPPLTITSIASPIRRGDPPV